MPQHCISKLVLFFLVKRCRRYYRVKHHKQKRAFTLKSHIELKTNNLNIQILQSKHIPLILKFKQENRSYLSQWELERELSYFSLEETIKSIKQHFNNFKSGNSISLIGLSKDKIRHILFVCTILLISFIVYLKHVTLVMLSINLNKENS